MDKALARRIERHCGNATQKELKKLLEIALRNDKFIGNDVYYSIVTGISYEELYKLNGLPTSKSNFYRLKTKTLTEFDAYINSPDKVGTKSTKQQGKIDLCNP